MAKIIVFGAGDIARLAHFYFTRDSEHTVHGFVVDDEYRQAESFLELPLIGASEVTSRFPPGDYQMFVALSYTEMNHARARKYGWAKGLGYTLASYVSSRCSYLSQFPPGDNCFILEDNTVQPYVRVGSNVTLWSGNHLGHDSTIEDHVFVSSHVVISGHCRVGSFCFLGVNSTLHNNVTLAEGTLVGAGAVITGATESLGIYLPPRSTKIDKTSDKVKM